MGLIILTTLMCLAHLSAATCPQYRPLSAHDTCTSNSDCPSGRSCCAYSGSSYCVSTDPNTCISDGQVVQKGSTIVLQDQCSECECRGYDDLICTNDACVWPKRVPRHVPQVCPMMKPFSANSPCTQTANCSSGYTCCKYFEGSFCTLADPNTCFFDGKPISRGKMVTLKDGCSECECQGHDSLMCTNDACHWPKPPKKLPQVCPMMKPFSAKTACTQSANCSSGFTCCKYFEGSFCTLSDPNTCYVEGKPIRRGKMVTLKDGCSECECQGHDSLMCIDDACHWPKLPENNGCYHRGIFRKNGESFADDCNTCGCNNGRVWCTLMGCLGDFNPLIQDPKKEKET